MKCFKAIFFCVIALMAIACRRSDSGVLERLDRAEALVMTDADSAMTSLLEIEPKRVRGREDRARYQLLMAMARYRLNDYSYPRADSLITLAVDYYSDADDPQCLMKSLFLRADILFRNSEYAVAMSDALNANEIAEKVACYDWRARSAEQIADIFAVTQNSYEALPYIERSIHYYRAAGKERNVRFALCDKAVAFERLNHLDESIQLLDSLILLAKHEPIDKSLLSYCYRTIYLPLYRVGQYERALESLRAYEQTKELSSNECSYMACVLIELGRSDEASPYLQRAHELSQSKYDKADEFRAWQDYYKANGNLVLANDYGDSLQMTVNSQIQDILHQTPLSVQRNIYSSRYISERENHQRSVIIGISIASLLLVLVVFVVLYYSYKLKLRQKDIENKMEDIHDLSIKLTETVTIHHKSDEKLRKHIEILFRNQWQTLNVLCNRFFEDQDSSMAKTLIFVEFKDQLSKLANRKNIQKIIDAVNEYMENILTRIQEEFPDMDDADVEFYALVLAGFTAKAVCLFTGVKYKTFYAKKSRFLSRINKDASPELVNLVVKYMQ